MKQLCPYARISYTTTMSKVSSKAVLEMAGSNIQQTELSRNNLFSSHYITFPRKIQSILTYIKR